MAATTSALSPTDSPIFVCPDGKPRRAATFLGHALLALTLGWLAAVVIGALGFLALPPLPGGLTAARPLPRHALALPRGATARDAVPASLRVTSAARTGVRT